jgi:hypothetical protein
MSDKINYDSGESVENSSGDLFERSDAPEGNPLSPKDNGTSHHPIPEFTT